MKKRHLLITLGCLIVMAFTVFGTAYADDAANTSASTTLALGESPQWIAELEEAKDAHQLFVVAAYSKSTAWITLNEKDENGIWQIIMTTPGFIGRNGLYKEKEGDVKTPVGTFHFNRAFGIAPDPGCRIDYVQVDDDTYWAGDSCDRLHYNELVELEDDPGLDTAASEHIVDYERQYQYCLNVSYNEENLPGLGSGIFLHCLGPVTPYTGGCIAIPEDQMLVVMQHVEPDCVVIINSIDALGGDVAGQKSDYYGENQPTPEPTEQEEAKVPDLEAGIAEISKNGNIVLTISPESMTALGYEPADLIRVMIGDAEMEMPIGTSYSDVDSGMPICCFKTASGTGQPVVVLAINSGNLTTAMDIAESQPTKEAPGYKWVFSDGLDESVTVYISMAMKQGYAEEYELHQLGNTRTNSRTDYPQLSDAEYANFRVVETSGMGTGTLYRSSSPVNPVLNRDEEADAALFNALVRTVINMADSDAGMRQYADYAQKHYSACDIIALDMDNDFTSDDYREKLAEGLRYLASHEGPYLIHCKEGKDRTGFALGILECLMGADTDEVINDYMLTYYNFYGIDSDSPQYQQIAQSNIEASLAKAFAISSIRDADTDLSACAEAYLAGIGMSGDEITALKENLAKDYGGITDAKVSETDSPTVQ